MQAMAAGNVCMRTAYYCFVSHSGELVVMQVFRQVSDITGIGTGSEDMQVPGNRVAATFVVAGYSCMRLPGE